MRTRIDRLVKDGKVVGYQQHYDGQIFHNETILTNKELSTKRNIVWDAESYILHDRIDQYTGVDVDGAKVFERDEGIIGGEAFTVKFINGSWSMITKRPRVDFVQDLYRNIKHARITGISGVN